MLSTNKYIVITEHTLTGPKITQFGLGKFLFMTYNKFDMTISGDVSAIATTDNVHKIQVSGAIVNVLGYMAGKGFTTNGFLGLEVALTSAGILKCCSNATSYECGNYVRGNLTCDAAVTDYCKSNPGRIKCSCILSPAVALGNGYAVLDNKCTSTGFVTGPMITLWDDVKKASMHISCDIGEKLKAMGVTIRDGIIVDGCIAPVLAATPLVALTAALTAALTPATTVTPIATPIAAPAPVIAAPVAAPPAPAIKPAFTATAATVFTPIAQPPPILSQAAIPVVTTVAAPPPATNYALIFFLFFVFIVMISLLVTFGPKPVLFKNNIA